MPQILAENAVNFDRDSYLTGQPVKVLEDDTFGIVLSYTQIRYEWSTPHEDTIIWYEVYWGSKGTTMCAEAHLERI